MATAVQKITLSSSRDIPFNKLVLSQSNVRRVKAGVSVEELAASIARRGLIQSLHVRPELDAEGKETGLFEVPAGGRRYRALEHLVKQKRLNKTAPVPCIVSEASDDILIDEVSLAENIERAPLHPLDQFRAFQTLREKGMSEEEIAAAFFVDAKVVKQRLRLVSVSPSLLDVYAEDGMTLEQLMAFSVSEDHARQEKVWEAIRDGWQKEPYYIRRLLTETTVRASDKRALFVGVGAYEDAGGCVLRDLFQQDDGGWLQDPVLLDRLVGEKLKADAETIAEEGWKWIEIAVDFPYGHTSGMRRLAGATIDLTDEERAEREKLRDEFDALEAEYAEADELPDEVDARLGEIEEALDALESRPMIYAADQMARAGVFVSIRHDGQLAVERGYVRSEDEVVEGQEGDGAQGASVEGGEPGSVQRAVITVGGAAPETEEDEEVETIRPLPDRLVSELTAHRTLALRDAVATNPHVAMTALLHRLVTDCFLPHSARGCLEAQVREVHFPAQAEDLGESASAKSIQDRHERWGDHIPANDAALWDWLADQDDDTRMELLAHCVSFGVNALHEKPNPYSGMGVSQHGLDVRLSQADRLARATGLDMVAVGWRPTVGNYLGRVTKPRIIEAVREGAGDWAAQLIDHLKKGDMAKEAERLLAETGWLPEPLRMVDRDAKVDTDADDLPEFLVDDGEDEEATEEEDAQSMVAAE
ncbi:ParB/RepB/Spo0J family partition protein [Bradyrhizobium sp. U87765 SZCCT0131]|jgi:ParB family chromosome partitioning protein|uniref:ParB family chromosome partitioning protein n=2 Tax=Hyphomicrobiales TaxID=356 RepID=A0A7W5Z7S3_9HYPH|nr:MULTISPECIES: ParB/RepB/Spo0J family partition protein [Alphaproteobacteria]MBB3811410.1 ParB family chromosome partitioning protein [Pseudochelatococcus contaminans]MBD3849347.1 ParB/RepB/Spo0J family partition protein [Bosea spartocytisi]MBR1216505.1 ParB/RepB/Spo0J family partition protein [Bradyrhizobium sp. U87765 SZCCT0131]MBR1259739.1 ParB/RepB/Spo0J family partition protein [Bradyrhizobium sp. U87765 SZCCT0134]MBR1305880.1 ParB/RepB/Spo0J family partition protein [Bradyrhizobium sp.